MQIFKRSWAWFSRTMKESGWAVRLIVGFFAGIGILFILLPTALIYELLTKLTADRFGPALRWTGAAVVFVLLAGTASALSGGRDTPVVADAPATPRPTSEEQDRDTPRPTERTTPQPTRRPTPEPAATPSPEEATEVEIAKAVMTIMLGADWIDSPLADGRPRVMSDPQQTEELCGSVEIIGAPDIEKVTALIPLTADMTQEQAECAGMMAGAVAGVTDDFSPWFSEVLNAHVVDVVVGDDWSEQTTAGEWTAEVEYLGAMGVLIVSAER